MKRIVIPEIMILVKLMIFTMDIKVTKVGMVKIISYERVNKLGPWDKVVGISLLVVQILIKVSFDFCEKVQLPHDILQELTIFAIIIPGRIKFGYEVM